MYTEIDAKILKSGSR